MSIGDSATPLGRVEGLGSAHHGGEHWLTERATSIALLLLGTWLIASLLLLPKLDQRTMIEWLHSPSGAVPMAFLVGADRHFRRVRVHRAVGQDDLDVAAAGAAGLPFRQRERAKVGHEIGFPHVLARPDRKKVPLACKVAIASDAFRKGEGIIEQKIFVAKDVEQEGQVVRRDEPHRLVS